MMTVRAVEKGTGRVRTGRIGGGSGSGGGVAPAFQADFTALSALPAGVLFSRASNAMVYDSTGKLTYAPNNLLLQSNNFGNAAWTKTNATVSSGVADPLGGTNATTITATGANAEVFQSVAVSTPGNYICAIWVRRRTGTGNVSLYTPRTDTTVVISITSTWTLFSTNGSIPSANGFCDFVLATSGDAIDVYAPTLSQVTYETSPRSADQVITTSSPYYGPRFDHAWNGSAWIAVGLLIEEQRTNLILQSDNLSAGWSPEFLTFGTGGTSPSGTTAQRLVEGVGSSRYSWLQAVSLPSAIYTLSFYAKENGRRYVTASLGATTTRIAFDLVAGTITQNDPNASGTITSLGSGLYRCTLTSVSAVAIDYIVFGLSDTGTPAWDSYGRTVYTATGSGAGIYFDDVQLEAGPFATSYIPTTTAAVTRSADIAQLTGAAQAAMQAVASTVLVEVDQVQGDYAQLMGADGSTVIARDGANTGRLYTEAVSPSLNLLVDTTATFRAGISKDGSGVSFVSNGGTVSTSSNPGTDFTGRNFRVGSRVDGYFINAHLRSIAIDTTRYSNADLQAKSVVGAAF